MSELEEFLDTFAGYDWDYCIRFYKCLRKTGTKTHQFEIGNMMLDLTRKLSEDIYLRDVSRVISHHCLRIGLPGRPIFRSPQIWIEWSPSDGGYGVGQPTEKELEWSFVDPDNILQVLQLGLIRIENISAEYE